MNIKEKNVSASKFGLFAILITAFVWNFEISALGPTLGVIGAAFPGTSDLTLQVLLLIPMMTAIFFSIIAGKLAKYFDKKTILIIGLLIYGVTGILPAFATSISQILIVRAITGIGVGFVLPMTNAIITDHSEGALRTRLIGLTTTVANTANTIISIVVGFLMVITWKAPFYTFAVVLVILIIVIIGVPKSPPSKINSDGSTGNEKTKLPGFAYIYTALMALVWLFAFTTIVTALFVTSEKLFAPQLIGFAVSSPGVGCMIGGLLFPVMFKALKKNIMTVSLVIYAFGYLCLFFSNGFVMLIIGNVLIGIGQGSMVAYIYCATAHKARTRAEKDMSLGLVSCAIGISAILQPFFMAAVGAINPGFVTPYRFLFLVGIIGLVLWIILAFFTRKDLGEPGMKAN